MTSSRFIATIALVGAAVQVGAFTSPSTGGSQLQFPIQHKATKKLSAPFASFHHSLATTTFSTTASTTTLHQGTSSVDTLYDAPGDGNKGTGTATIPQEIFNLVKGIVGAGVLTLPAGIAAFGNAPGAAIPAVALICVIGTLSAYGFALIGRVCSLTDTTSFRDAWSASVSSETSWIPAVSVTMKTCFAVLAYSMILGETFSSLAATAGFAVSKQVTLVGVTTAVLFPLCLLKNLSSLAPFSLLGSLGMIYTAIAMGIRYFGKAYVGTGRFAKDLPKTLQPAFGTVGAAGILNPSTAILVGMLSTAYMAHFNAPKYVSFSLYL
jgi:amino acid permease